MDESIVAFITQYIPLSEADIQVLRDQHIFRGYRKHDILLKEGELARECYFVVKGCVRAYYLVDGEERNTAFFTENQTIRPVSYQTHRPSAYFISCLEDSILAIGSEERNRELVEKIPGLASMVIQMNDALLVEKTIELDNFKNQSPEERYLMLLESRPELLNRIPLYHLASYLGITPISLSRIRSRVMRRKLS